MFHHFTNCVADFNGIELKGRAETSGISNLIQEGIRDHIKFYLPDGGQILENREIDDEIKSIIRLPFPQISILHPINKKNPFLAITCTSEIGYEDFKMNWPMNPFKNCDINDGRIIILASAINPSKELWLPLPGFIFCLIEKGNSIRPHMIRDPGMFPKEKAEALDSLLYECLYSVFNIACLLNLENVKRKRIRAPRRSTCENLPLYDYHILEVNGDRWDSESKDGNGSGIRSHFRRGHIRRISEDRKTFVRAAVVLGSRPGFIDKDYAVTSS